MDKFLEYFLYFLFFYFLLRIIGKWIWPKLLKVMATKFRDSLEKRFNQEFQNRYKENFDSCQSNSENIKTKNQLKTKKNHQVGEYIDFEEVD